MLWVSIRVTYPHFRGLDFQRLLEAPGRQQCLQMHMNPLRYAQRVFVLVSGQAGWKELIFAGAEKRLGKRAERGFLGFI